MQPWTRNLLIAFAAAAILAAGWIAVRPDHSRNGPAGDPNRGPGTEDPGENGGQEPPPPPPPGGEVRQLLRRREREPDGVRKELSELSRTADGVREIIGAIELSTSARERALLFLHLVRGGTAEGLAHARTALAGKGRKEDRIPALYALADGDAGDVETIAQFLADPGDEELYRAAIFALALRGDDASLHFLEGTLTGASSEARRSLFYASLGDGPSRPDDEFLALIREAHPGLQGGDTTRPGYRRLIDRVSREEIPELVPRAAELLLRLPGADAQRGVTDLWKSAAEEVRPGLTETILANLQMDRSGAAGTVATIARGLDEEEGQHHRAQIRTRIREIRDAAALPVLREWRDGEEDPEIRQTLEEEIRRIETEEQPR